LRGRVPLLGRGRLIGLEDRLDDGLEGPEDGCRPRLGQRVRLGLGVLQGLADGIPPDPKLLGDLPRAQAVTMGLANPGEVVHGAHPDPLRPARPIAEVVLPWTWIRCRSGPELDADHQASILLMDESGLLMAPLVRRSWSPRGRPPALEQKANHR